MYTMSPNFHWQKSSLTVGCDSFRDHRLGYLDVAIVKLACNLVQKIRDMQVLRPNVRFGYLDVAIVKLACNLVL